MSNTLTGRCLSLGRQPGNQAAWMAIFKPVAHGGVESMLAGWLDTSGLPHKPTGDVASKVAHWRAAGLEVPE